MDKAEDCEEFTIHEIRKLCKKCRKPRENHPLAEDDVMKVKELLRTDPADSKSNELYAWTPPRCPLNRLGEYFKKFPEDKVPRHKSTGQKDRLIRLKRQIPLSDLSVDNCRFVDREARADLENFIQKLHDGALKVGTVKEWCQGMPMQCPKCLLILEPGELVVVSCEGGPCFHPACFVCFQCNEPLADLVHCSDINGTIFCIRHYCDNVRKRCHACDELIFSSRYALAGQKFFHRDHLLCFVCDRLLQGNKGYENEGELYCADCYEKKFCKDCIKCKKMITLDNRHVSYRDDNWHYECFTCNKCDVVLSDSPFEIVEEKFYCSDCYNKDFAPKCEGCSELFDANAKVVKYEDKLFHVPCFKCVDCADSIGTGSFVPHEGRVYCKACHLLKFGVRCLRCKYPITDDRGIMYNKEPYHEDCFTCHRCNTKIASRPFKTVEDNWYCMGCYGETFCKKCHSCGDPILLGADQDVLYSYEDFRWHAGCFICSICKNSLAETPFVMREKVLVCNTCIQNKEETSSSKEKTATLEKKEEHDQSETVAS